MPYNDDSFIYVIPNKMRTAYLSYTTRNIGDDIQSYALEKILGPPDLFINRDHFDDYNNEGKISLIANGWFIDGPFPPPSNIHPKYVAFCIGNLQNKGAKIVPHLKSCEPIGCRDHQTLLWCESRGIKCYFSSCPSILLERSIQYNPEGPIVLIDVDPNLLPPTTRPIEQITHEVRAPERVGQNERRNTVTRLLDLYQSASLVITRRLHAAMPCLGFGLPVIVVAPKITGFRFGALPESVTIHQDEDLRSISMDPREHFHEISTWKNNVDRKLRRRF